MLVPNSQFTIVEVSKSIFDKYSPAFDPNQEDEGHIVHKAWEGTVYAVGE